MADKPPVKTLKERRAEEKTKSIKKTIKKMAGKQMPLVTPNLKKSNMAQNIITETLDEIGATGVSETSNANVWDTAEQLRLQCWELYRTPSGLIPIVTNPAVLNSPQAQDIAKLAKQLEKDLSTSEVKLRELHALHEGKSGAGTDPEDFFTASQIANEYINWMNNYTALIFPLMSDITHLAAQAESAGSPETADALIESING